MKNITIGVIATSLVVLFSGLSVFFIPFAGSISALIPNMPDATLIVVSSIVDLNSAWANGIGSCCICIPIPIAFGFFALFKRANMSTLEEPSSEPGADG